MVVQLFNTNPEGTRCDRVGDHCTNCFLKRNPSIATTVARAVGRGRVLPLNEESLKTYFDDLEDCIRQEPELRPQYRRPAPIEMELPRTTRSNTLEDAHSQIDALGSAAQKLEADLAVAKAELHQALIREGPAKWRRTTLSKTRYVTQADFEGALHAQETPLSTNHKGESVQKLNKGSAI